VSIALYQRAVLTCDLPEEGLRSGDVGVVVEHYAASDSREEGYEVEFFAASGETIAVVSVAGAALRRVTGHEILAVREFARAS
jgi:hypothetical protein